jgi:hypothetical protein
MADKEFKQVSHNQIAVVLISTGIVYDYHWGFFLHSETSV